MGKLPGLVVNVKDSQSEPCINTAGYKRISIKQAVPKNIFLGPGEHIRLLVLNLSKLSSYININLRKNLSLVGQFQEGFLTL